MTTQHSIYLGFLLFGMTGVAQTSDSQFSKRNFGPQVVLTLPNSFISVPAEQAIAHVQYQDSKENPRFVFIGKVYQTSVEDQYKDLVTQAPKHRSKILETEALPSKSGKRYLIKILLEDGAIWTLLSGDESFTSLVSGKARDQAGDKWVKNVLMASQMVSIPPNMAKTQNGIGPSSSQGPQTQSLEPQDLLTKILSSELSEAAIDKLTEKDFADVTPRLRAFCARIENHVKCKSLQAYFKDLSEYLFAKARQGEAKSMLLTAFTMEKARYAEKDSYSQDVKESLGTSFLGTERYVYGTLPQCSANPKQQVWNSIQLLERQPANAQGLVEKLKVEFAKIKLPCPDPAKGFLYFAIGAGQEGLWDIWIIDQNKNLVNVSKGTKVPVLRPIADESLAESRI